MNYDLDANFDDNGSVIWPDGSWQRLAEGDDKPAPSEPSPAIAAYHTLFEHQDMVIERHDAERRKLEDEVTRLRTAIKKMVQLTYGFTTPDSVMAQIADIGQEALAE